MIEFFIFLMFFVAILSLKALLPCPEHFLMFPASVTKPGLGSPSRARADTSDKQLIRLRAQRGPQSRAITSVGNCPADSDMIPRPCCDLLE